MPRHWAVLIGDLVKFPPLGFIVNLVSGGAPCPRALAICRHVRETCVAVPYNTWRYPALLSRTPVWRDVQPGFSAGALAGFVSTDFHTEMKHGKPVPSPMHPEL